MEIGGTRSRAQAKAAAGSSGGGADRGISDLQLPSHKYQPFIKKLPAPAVGQWLTIAFGDFTWFCNASINNAVMERKPMDNNLLIIHNKDLDVSQLTAKYFFLVCNPS